MAALSVGCEGDSSPGEAPIADGGPVFFDAGDPPGQDAAGPPVTPPKGTGVTITIHVAGAPAAGMDVILHDETGAVTGQLKADASGVASAPVAPKQLTVFLPGGPLTYTDVEEGDALVLDIPGDPDDAPPTIGTLSITVEGNDTILGGYAATAGNCRGDTATAGVAFDVALRPGCVKGSKTTVLAMAFGGVRGVQYQLTHDVAVPANGGTKAVGFSGGGSWSEDNTQLGIVKLVGGATNASSSLDFFYDGVRFGMGIVRVGDVLNETGEEYVVPPRAFDTLVSVEFKHPAQSLSHSWMATREILGTNDAVGGGFAHTFRVSEALPPITEASATVVGDRLQIKAAMSGASSVDLVVAQVAWRSSFGGEGAPDDKWTFVMSPKRTTWTSPALPPGFVGPTPQTELTTAFAYFESDLVASFADAKTLPLDPSMRNLREPRMKDTSIQPATKRGTVRLSMVEDLQN